MACTFPAVIGSHWETSTNFVIKSFAQNRLVLHSSLRLKVLCRSMSREPTIRLSFGTVQHVQHVELCPDVSYECDVAQTANTKVSAMGRTIEVYCFRTILSGNVTDLSSRMPYTISTKLGRWTARATIIATSFPLKHGQPPAFFVKIRCWQRFLHEYYERDQRHSRLPTCILAGCK